MCSYYNFGNEMNHKTRLEDDRDEIDNDIRSIWYYTWKFIKDVLILMWEVVFGVFRR